MNCFIVRTLELDTGLCAIFENVNRFSKKKKSYKKIRMSRVHTVKHAPILLLVLRIPSSTRNSNGVTTEYSLRLPKLRPLFPRHLDT